MKSKKKKNVEKKAVGSLLAQKVLKTEVISSEEESAFCVGLVFASLLVILLLTMLITKWSFFDLFVGV
ncbi:hypothetical protein MK385_04465 [Streptococcus oralis]|jgi:hypothetical protein|uniref:Uncharacterized protein n=1 Tax=Streptococcus oralis TaxID=1303 RepID=A0A3R9I854_STROR|nr:MULTISPECIES: hypothetical protein [Streptococcus]MCP9125479.1 hypothetical protein [Streptococcus oralis]MCY7062031.1 hypothetical protein [Streptococcus oralis]RSI72070.1 hypothetical protein D8857_05690 [Streptococcus oralis]VJW14972.1 Uncharacterised protein [Streptococcus pneumoniae]